MAGKSVTATGPTTGKLKLSRRVLLRTGLAGSLFLSAGAFLGCRRSTGGQKALKSDGLVLCEGARQVVAAASVAVLGELLPADPVERRVALAAAIDTIDDYLGHFPVHVQDEARQVFWMLGLWPVRALLAGVHAPWTEASPEELVAWLDSWQHSRWSLLREIYVLLQSLVSLGWFANPPGWPALGYPEPTPIVPLGREWLS